MRGLGWVSNCRFLQLSDGQEPRLVNSFRNTAPTDLSWPVSWKQPLPGAKLYSMGTITFSGKQTLSVHLPCLYSMGLSLAFLFL